MRIKSILSLWCFTHDCFLNKSWSICLDFLTKNKASLMRLAYEVIMFWVISVNSQPSLAHCGIFGNKGHLSLLRFSFILVIQSLVQRGATGLKWGSWSCFTSPPEGFFSSEEGDLWKTTWEYEKEIILKRSPWDLTLGLKGSVYVEALAWAECDITAGVQYQVNASLCLIVSVSRQSECGLQEGSSSWPKRLFLAWPPNLHTRGFKQRHASKTESTHY